MSEGAQALPRVSDLAVVSHRSYVDSRGALFPIELSQVLDFTVVRLFWVGQVPENQERGGHAHKDCSQYLVCLQGQVEISVHDGTETAVFMLEPGQALLIRPGLWASERYVGIGAMLLVLCDRPYDRDDYIADMDAFLSYRRKLAV